MTKSSRYAQQIIISQAGTMQLGWYELSKFLSYSKSSYHCFTVLPRQRSPTYHYGYADISFSFNRGVVLFSRPAETLRN